MADVTVTVTIPDGKVASLRDGFLKMLPIPQTYNPVTEEMEDDYTTKEWLAEKIASYIESVALRGLRTIAEEAVDVDVTINRA